MKEHVILSARELRVGYDKKTILDHVDLTFSKGEFISLLGPNGAGKTTLLRTLSNYLPALSGKILIKGEPLERITPVALSKIMSVVLTEKTVPPLFRVFDYIAMGRYPHTSWSGRLTSKDDQVVLEAARMVHAEALLTRDLSTLSDGERQKVQIARALAQEPEIILLDEPTMHLDLKHRMEVMGILQSLCREKGICVVASLHDVEVAAKVSDRVVLVNNGSIDACGAPEEVLEEEVITRLYDFSNARFSRILGNIEIRHPAGGPKVFVMGGMGKAAVLYRLLSKKGFDIATGVLLKNDIDYFVASALGAECIVQETLEAISGNLAVKAVDLALTCDAVIDAGCDLDGAVLANRDILDAVPPCGKAGVQPVPTRAAGRDPKA